MRSVESYVRRVRSSCEGERWNGRIIRIFIEGEKSRQGNFQLAYDSSKIADGFFIR